LIESLSQTAGRHNPR